MMSQNGRSKMHQLHYHVGNHGTSSRLYPKLTQIKSNEKKVKQLSAGSYRDIVFIVNPN